MQVSIPCYNSKISGKADALIYAFYVDSGYRRKRSLQNDCCKFAEQQAKLSGVKIIGIEFDKEESESFVLDWYFRSGYKPFKKKSNLLIKELKG